MNLYQYYIVEVQKYADGSYGHIVHIAYDEDPDKARLKGDAKYYEILSAAAISTLPQHAVSLLAATGRAVDSKCYYHDAVTPEE